MQGAADNVVPDEDQARAHCYALISRLFYAPADADLLKHLAGPPAASTRMEHALQSENVDAAPDTNAYTSAFAALQEVCRTVDADTVRRASELGVRACIEKGDVAKIPEALWKYSGT